MMFTVGHLKKIIEQYDTSNFPNLDEILMKVLKDENPTYHSCVEWDGLVICDQDPEFDACMCEITPSFPSNKGGFIVKILPIAECYLSYSRGYPGWTLVRDSAKVFNSVESAVLSIQEALYLFPNLEWTLQDFLIKEI